ncbi:TonB-dependent receptor [bacterium]|nr:MAG: TonB-dependent receptor [bacterium]|tara:strand:- start:4612 stop:7188 length:2577 start_codon:yes stop_codon:yes gene_type:complete
MYYILCLVLSFQFILSQDGKEYQMPGTGIILGEIINQDSGAPIEYASVTLINKESNDIITGQLTDNNGIFVFKEVKNGDYFIEIKFMGYDDWSSEIIKINSSYTKPTRRDLQTIQLSTKALEGRSVNITEKKEMYEFEADKLVYNPDNDIVASAGTAEDVLNRAPMVTVDQDGEIQLRGNGNVNVLVDGRKNRVDLANISGSQIEKVEVITSASAKYDPEGMAGIINIVLKKGTNDGFNGNVQLKGQHNEYHSFDEMNGLSFYGNYKKNKFNFFSSIGLNNRFKNRGGYRNTIKEYSNNQFFDNIEYADSVFYDYSDDTERKTISFRMGLDYYLFDNMTLTNEIKISKPEKLSITHQEYFKPIIYEEETREQKSDDNYDLSYLFEFDKEFKDPDQSLDFSINVDLDIDEETKDLFIDNALVNRTNFNEDYTGMEIDLSYKQPIGEKLKFEIGYQGQLQDNPNTLSFDANVIADTLYGIISNESNLKRDIHAFYFEFENDFNDKFSIKPSFRIESVNRRTIFNSYGLNSNFNVDSSYNTSVLDDIIREYQNEFYDLDDYEFYPFLNFTYNITKNENIQFGFGKRVNRPSGWNTRPFPNNIYNENFVFVGNPNLKPEYSTQYDINYSRPIPMGFASVNLFYHEISNKHEWYDDNQFPSGDVLTFRNVENAWSKGISIFTMVMGQTIGGGYTLTDQSDSDNPDDYELNEQSERLNMYGRIKFPEKYIKVFDFEFGFYWMKMILPSGNLFGNKGTIWGDIGISKKFMNKKLTVSLAVDNIFDSGGFEMKRNQPITTIASDANGDGIEENYNFAREYSDVNNTRNGRTLKLTLKYQIGKKSDDKKGGYRGGGSGGGGMMDMGY